MSTIEKTILFIGFSCLDIISMVNDYPKEDLKSRVLDQRWSLGGNASNNCIVINKLKKWYENTFQDKKLDLKIEYFGCLGTDLAGVFLRNWFESNNIIIENVEYVSNNDTPTSVVIINKSTGSRTILHHNKNFPEPSLQSFFKLDFKKYDWIHFSERNQNIDMIQLCLQHINSFYPSIIISMELEKTCPETEIFLSFPFNYIFIESCYSRMLNYACLDECKSDNIRSDNIIFIWGEYGSKGFDKSRNEFRIPIYKPLDVVDTLGAGDTYVASTIFSILILDKKLEDSLNFASQVAGAKCGLIGYDGLEDFTKILRSKVKF